MEITIPPADEYVPHALRLLVTYTLPALFILAIMLIRLGLVFIKKGYYETLTVVRSLHIALVIYCCVGVLISSYYFLSDRAPGGELWATRTVVIGICCAVHGLTLIAAGLLMRHAAITIRRL